MIKTRHSRFATTALMAALLVASTIGAPVWSAEPTMAQRLARLTEELESQRQELHIPGMAVAVVQGDEVIYSRGFGVADLESGRSVTPETLFAIGSSTKAFTASLIGMLVDGGKMGWDDPVTNFLPYFELEIDTDDPEATVTIRDLLAHRTGFTRMGILWAGGAVPREEVLRVAVHAEPWSPFREQFNYSNIGFLAAGVASGVAADSSWETLLSERLLTPLGMENSSSSIDVAQTDDRLSRGYRWSEETQSYEHLPMRSLGGIAPAGAINSNVLDMAQWLRFQLGRGTVGGQVLLSAAQHGETWSKQIEAAPGVDYGLGWMMRSVDGHRLVEHGGSIDGFAAEVALFPDVDLGFVLLTNVTTTPLQGLSPKLVLDALVAEWDGEGEQRVVEADLEAHAGRYEANFGPFKEAYFTVSVKGDRLFIDVPGQMDYQLEPPDDEGKWYFSLTDQIAVSFDRTDDGQVQGLKMYQSGMTFELPREGVERLAEIELSELEPYLGKYHFEEKDIDFEVKISNQRLAVDVPGEMVFELHPPNEEGEWVFRVTDRVSVSFRRSETGEVISLLFREGEQQGEMLRVEAPEQEELPTVEEVLALREGIADATSFRITAGVRLVHAGLKGRLTLSADASGHLRSDTDFGRFGWIHEVESGDQAWVDSNIQPFRNLEGKYLTQARVARALLLAEGWPQLFDSMTVTGTEMLDERKTYVLDLRVGDLPAIRAWLDAQTGDLLRYEMSVLDPGLGIAIPTVTRQEDFRDVDGMRIAFRMVSRNAFVGETILEVEEVETEVSFEGELFSPPPSSTRVQ